MGAYYYDGGLRKRTKTISITSGKGGVGKTTLISNLALYLGKMGKRVLVLDGDLGMSNVDIMFGVRSRSNIYNLIIGEREISDVVTNVADNVDLLPGGSGIYELQDLDVYQKKALIDQVDELAGEYDYMLIDTAPGIAENVLYLNAAADEIMVILTPDPSSLTDSYSLIKVLNERYRVNNFSVLCNFVKDEKEALRCFQRVSDVAMDYLNVRLQYKGFVPLDQNLRNATKSQQLILNSNPRCPSSFAIKHLGEKVSGLGQIQEASGGIQMFWHQIVGVA
ncbi:MAG: flagellar biosynthesis switch protein [Bdellovibrionaceae bacterium]|nr:flagellar biosynthesis switch protein [Pseudobdellovibrionaceae bacterium]|tara:strand:- start:20464 stop:21300 length:837 start_codon:yes stop_codon:yes gene_type:complete